MFCLGSLPPCVADWQCGEGWVCGPRQNCVKVTNLPKPQETCTGPADVQVFNVVVAENANEAKFLSHVNHGGEGWGQCKYWKRMGGV
jgi:hypothetical protein